MKTGGGKRGTHARPRPRDQNEAKGSETGEKDEGVGNGARKATLLLVSSVFGVSTVDRPCLWLHATGVSHCPTVRENILNGRRLSTRLKRCFSTHRRFRVVFGPKSRWSSRPTN